MEILQKIQESEFFKVAENLFNTVRESGIYQYEDEDIEAQNTFDAMLLIYIEVGANVKSFDDIIALVVCEADNLDTRERFRHALLQQKPYKINEETLLDYMHCVQNLYYLALNFSQSDDECFNMLIKVFTNYGFSPEQIKDMLDNNIEKLKSELLGKYMTPLSYNDDSIFSIIMLQYEIFYHRIYEKRIQDLAKRKQFIFLYRMLEELKVNYHDAYNDIHNLIVLYGKESEIIFQSSEEQEDEDLRTKYAIIIYSYVITTYGLERYINLLFAILSSKLASLEWTYEIYEALNKYAKFIDPYYQAYCDKNNIPQKERIVFTRIKQEETSIQELFKLPECNFRTPKLNEKGAVALKKENKEKGAKKFETLVCDLAENKYIDLSLDAMYTFVYRVSSIEIKGRTPQKCIDWHGPGKTLRYIISELCEMEGRNGYKELEPYFNITSENIKLSKVTASAAKNVKKEKIYEIFSRYNRK